MTKTPPPSPLIHGDAINSALLWLVAVAFFMESIDTSIINTAIPTIARAMNVEPFHIKVALTSYTLSLAAFIPISGWLADRFGTRRVFASAIAIFTLGSLLAGLAINLPILVAARILQGFGGAMMMPVGSIAMVRTFPKAALVKAMSFVAIPGLIGPLVGPLTGGIIVHFMHWRVIFFINLPIGLAGFYMALRHMPDYRSEEPARLDMIGFLLFGIGITLISSMLEEVGEFRANIGKSLGLLVASLALLGLYWRHAMSTARPILQLDLFRVRTFRMAVAGSFLMRIGVGGMPFLLPLFYQLGLGYAPWQAGMLIMPQAIAAIMMKALVQRVLKRFGYRSVLVVNTFLLGAQIVLFSTVSSEMPTWIIVLQAFFFGLFTSLQYSCVNSLVFSDLGDGDTSMGSSISSTLHQLSTSFGIAAAALAVGVTLKAGSRASEMTDAIHYAFLILSVMTMTSALIFSRLRHSDGRSVSRSR